MIITFHSLDNEGNKVFFKSEAEIIGKYFIFDDKSQENTKIKLMYDTSSINIERIGNTNMKINLSLDEITNSKYSNSLGLKFDFKVKTNELDIKSNKLYAMYDLILDENVISTHKIWIIFN